jgi:C1A family cysteine protease
MARLVLVLLALVLAASAMKLLENDSALKFLAFQHKYGKTYATEAERLMRFEVFKSNLLRANELNRRNGDDVFGVTKFSDLTAEEFRETYLMNVTMDAKEIRARGRPLSVPQTGVAFTTWDWGINKTGVVTPVKNQAQCGSCWAFSATETIESAWALAGNTLTALAPQQIVSCDTVDQGCNGGWPYHAYEYVIAAGGMVSETNFPYHGTNGVCNWPNHASSIAAHISSWYYVDTDPQGENSTLLPIVAMVSPVSVCVDASSWQLYSHGVLRSCGDQIDHCVQLTGFSTQTSTKGAVPAWNVRNSWGADWGVNGYIYIERNQNLCAISTQVTLPVV